MPLPADLKPVLPPRWLALVLIRYQEGTLRYDEFIIGALARHRLRFGIYVHHIWVNDVASLWGGRRIWGLNKQLANFEWGQSEAHGDEGIHSVRISDESGLIAHLGMNKAASHLPAIPLPAPGIGYLDGHVIYTTATMRVRLGRPGLHVLQWSPRFPYSVASRPSMGIAAKPMQVIVHAPHVLK